MRSLHRRVALVSALGLLAIGIVAGPVRAQIGSSAPAPGPEPTSGPTVDNALVAELATADPTALVRVLARAADISTAETAATAAGLTIQDRFPRVGIAVAVGRPADVETLLGDGRVLHVEADAPLQYALDTSHRATRGATVMDGFDVTTAAGTRHLRYDGSGVSIAILDSGIDGTHPFFQNEDGTSKVARNLDLVCSDVAGVLAGDGACEPAWVDSPTGDSDTNSAGGHGTHVAGIAAGYRTELSDGRVISGAAPGATLIGLSAGAGLNVYGGTSGLYWVLEHHLDPCGDGSCPPIRVVNNSWGASGGGDYDPESATSVIVDQLVADGVVVAFAQGNDGGDGTTSTSNPYAIDPTPGVIGVANYDDGGIGTRDGALDSTSSRGEEGRPATYPDIAAPGANILSSCRIYLPVCSTGLDFVENGDYNTISGTSMATPHIAGIVAQLFQAADENGIDATPAMIEDVLEDTAHPFASGGPYEYDATNPDTGTSFDKGHGLVDVVAAVTRLVAPGAVAPEAANECVADGPVLVDASGDAVNYLGQPVPTGNQSSLDIVSADITEWDTTGNGLTDSLRFRLHVADLTEEPPAGALGEYFDWNFDYEGAGYYLGLGWDRTAEPRFLVGNFGGDAGTRNTLVEIPGEVDVDKDVFVAYLPFDALYNELDGTVPVIVAGSVLGGHSIVSRYDQGAVVPDDDTATGACPYTVALGAVPPPVDANAPIETPIVGQLPDGEADASLHAGESVTFHSDPGTAFVVEDGLVGVVREPVEVSADGTATFTIDLLVTGDTDVTVAALADNAEVEDIDLHVTTQDGTAYQSADIGGDESVTFTTPYTQRIAVEVERYLTVEAGWELTVTLG